MLCRACQEAESQAASPEEPPPKRRRPNSSAKAQRKRGGRVADDLCSRCGHLIGTEATVKNVQAKQSQLARFGLSGKRGALLKRKPREDR